MFLAQGRRAIPTAELTAAGGGEGRGCGRIAYREDFIRPSRLLSDTSAGGVNRRNSCPPFPASASTSWQIAVGGRGVMIASRCALLG
ncbi:hypothetical protein EYF80_027218 [Liparis tanakae]|uniref:Uncharacterized protein n=1 Tax=Liparis tanakae TaxID=230148 RepID=A0A4Z2HB69_9TELE|nr:hypothetical protein EYF80_027218 [Liparis tanakae]